LKNGALKMKVLVIGGSGLLGMKLQKVLAGAGFDVYVTFHQHQLNEKN